MDRFEPETHHVVEEPFGFLVGEPQVDGAQFDELVAGAKPGQR